MKFKLEKKLKSGVRVGEITARHGRIKTPVFMPVGTVGAVKSVAPWELRELGAEIILGNTYHLYLRPGEKIISKFGGLARFSGWNGPMLTDSGGFQVFSLGEKNLKSQISNLKNKEGDFSEKQTLVKITEDGVEFSSHLDGSKHFFTPEKVIDIQLALGADIIMPLDVCPPAKAPKKEISQAVELSTQWLKRSKKHLDGKRLKDKPALFAIVQGGVYTDQRIHCAQQMIQLDLPGYAIGGLAVGEAKEDMWRIVKLLDGILPKNKPRYLMGVGTPDDLIAATKLGMDMFDCVLPTRLGRHGVAYRRNLKSQISNLKIKEKDLFEEINLNSSKYRADKDPIDINCRCPACRAQIISNSHRKIHRSEAKADKNKFSKAYLHHLVKEKEILGIRLLTLHNLFTYFELMQNIRSRV